MSAQSQHEARAAIRPVKERVEDDLIARPGVVAVDIAEKVSQGKPTGELSIVVFVEQKQPEDALRDADVIPQEIDGVKTDVQELKIVLQDAVRFAEVRPQVDAGAYTTITGGIGIGPARTVFLSPPDVPSPGNYVFVSTLGAIVEDRTTHARMALTNFHVGAVNNTWSVGDVMVQPSRVDGGPATGHFGTLTRAVLTENTDGSVITIDIGRATGISVEGIGAVAGQGVASVGMAVQKRGRTTEHTFGNVVSTDFTLSVDYGSDVGPHTLRHQIRIDTDTTQSTRFSDHGDSGSVVMDMSRNVVGLLFAGSDDGVMTFANPIQVALDELGVNLLTDTGTLFTKPPICDTFLTRPVICNLVSLTTVCNFITKTVICSQITKPKLCLDLQTSSAVCVISKTCPTTLTCGPGGFDPGQPVQQPGGRGLGGQYGDPDDAVQSIFVAGYLAALEAVDDAVQSEG